MDPKPILVVVTVVTLAVVAWAGFELLLAFLGLPSLLGLLLDAIKIARS